MQRVLWSIFLKDWKYSLCEIPISKGGSRINWVDYYPPGPLPHMTSTISYTIIHLVVFEI